MKHHTYFFLKSQLLIRKEKKIKLQTSNIHDNTLNFDYEKLLNMKHQCQTNQNHILAHYNIIKEVNSVIMSSETFERSKWQSKPSSLQSQDEFHPKQTEFIFHNQASINILNMHLKHSKTKKPHLPKAPNIAKKTIPLDMQE